MAQKVAFIGLGVMGFPMAGHLAAKGFDVTVFNRNQARAKAWTEKHKGRSAASPREAAQGCEIVFSCVGADDDLRQIAYGDDGLLAGMAKGALYVDHTTASAVVARELFAAAKERGLGFLDAPVSGGQAGAENGVLTVMVGGEQADYAKAEAAIKCYARMMKLLGPAGSGQLCKMVNQVCIAGLVQALSEGLNLAVAAGLDGEAVVETISKGAAQSWQMENRHKGMLAGKYDYGFAIQWMRKDRAIAMAEAKKLGLTMPVTALVDQFYAECEAMGGKRWDTSGLMARLVAARPKG